MSSKTEIPFIQNPRPFPFISLSQDLPFCTYKCKNKIQRASLVIRLCSTGNLPLVSVIFCHRIFLILTLQLLPLLLRMGGSCEQKTNKDCEMELLFHISANVLFPIPLELVNLQKKGKTNQPHTTQPMLGKTLQSSKNQTVNDPWDFLCTNFIHRSNPIQFLTFSHPEHLQDLGCFQCWENCSPSRMEAL